MLSRIHIIASLSRSSHGGVLLSVSFRVIWAKGLGKQTVSEPVARDHHAFLLRLETKRPTIAEVVSREYTRATLAQSGYQFSFTAPFARVQLSSFFGSLQLPRSHRLYRRSRHSPLRNGVLIRRLVAGNNNLRHTSFVSTNLSKRRGIHSRNSFSWVCEDRIRQRAWPGSRAIGGISRIRLISLQIGNAGIKNDVASDNDENKFVMAAI